MDCPIVHFNTVQLTKLVSSADLIFQHVYESVSAENKVFIDQWFCYKQEFDEISSKHSDVDVNENLQECPVLARIDEVSENEKISSISSASTSCSDSSMSCDKVAKENSNTAVKEEAKSIDSALPKECKEDSNFSQFDSDLMEYTTDFKLLTDNYVSDWFKSLSLNTNEVKQYMNWLQSEEYKAIWNGIDSNASSNGGINQCERNEYDRMTNQPNLEFERGFVPIQTSHDQMRPFMDEANHMKQSYNCHMGNFDVGHRDTFADQYNYLQKIRNALWNLRRNLNSKFKNKDELKSSMEFETFLKIDVAYEIIDSSIELKNQLQLGHSIDDLITFKDEVDAIINDCLRTLSLSEIRYLLFTYMSNVIEMRKCSAEHDQQLKDLERESAKRQFLIWKLYNLQMNIPSQKIRCLALDKEFEQKLQLMGKETTDESNEDPFAGVQGRLKPILEKSVHDSSQSESRDLEMAMSCLPNIPEKSMKILRSTSGLASSTKVERNNKSKKIRITSLKH